MTDALYQKAILDRARAATGAGPLPSPDARAAVDNPLCGDRVAVEITLDDIGRIAALGHRVRGCVLCEAAASVLAAHAPGRTPAELRADVDATEAMLRAGAPAPWRGMEIFEPVRAVKGRHDCVLLPFRALTEALDALPNG